MLFLSYSVIHTSSVCHFYFLQKTSGSEALFCTTDDVILKGTGKCRKQCTVACHAYYQKGMHMQFNVVDRQTLLDAQEHPEKYKHLVVRVAGYSALSLSGSYIPEIPDYSTICRET